MSKKYLDYCLSVLKFNLLVACIVILGLGLMRPAAATQNRDVRVVVGGDALVGQSTNFSVEMVSLGNENSVAFSLSFNPLVFTAPIVSLGQGANGATLVADTSQAASGRLGITLTYPSGQSFTTGTQQLITVSANVPANAPLGTTQIAFADQPVIRAILDGSANSLPATYTPASLNVIQSNPNPVLIGLTPATRTLGGAGFSLSVIGQNFVSGSTVRWNGGTRITNFVSSTRVTAFISATDIANAGTATVTVINPPPGGGLSNSLTFTITNPAPTLTAITPSTANANSGNVNIALTGTNFLSTSVVQFNNMALTTNFVSDTQLTAVIPAATLTAGVAADIIVVNPAPGGGPSNALPFTVNNQLPAIASLNPSSAIVGGPAFTLTVSGSGFVSTSTVQWKGVNRTTTFVSPTVLTASIPASDIAATGTAAVTVVNPSPGGGTSNALNFSIIDPNPMPTLTSISPNTGMATGPAFTLTVNGTGFINGSTVRWNGNSRTTTFVSATQLTAAIPATDIAAVGTASVTVFTPAPGGGTSQGVTFTIVAPNPAPMISRLNPNFANTGGPAFPLSVIGTQFTNSSVIQWNGSDRPTTFISATELRAAIPATDIATAGTYNIRVVTPQPGGGTTSTLPFLVAAPLTSVSAASFLGPQLGAESIIAGFGQSLATRIASATVQPLPTDLAGTKIVVRDSLGTERTALQFYVSPGQANYQLPPDTADGDATVILTSGDNKISVGGIQVARVVPGIFTANANGLGVAAATVLRVRQDGSQVFEPIVRFDSTTNRFISLPVDFGAATDQLFLVMFGTGFRYRSALNAITVSIGGTSGDVTFAGPAPGFIGLDQCNVRLPRSLAGRGEMDVVFTANGKTANTVRLNMR